MMRNIRKIVLLLTFGLAQPSVAADRKNAASFTRWDFCDPCNFGLFRKCSVVNGAVMLVLVALHPSKKE